MSNWSQAQAWILKACPGLYPRIKDLFLAIRRHLLMTKSPCSLISCEVGEACSITSCFNHSSHRCAMLREGSGGAAAEEKLAKLKAEAVEDLKAQNPKKVLDPSPKNLRNTKKIP